MTALAPPEPITLGFQLADCAAFALLKREVAPTAHAKKDRHHQAVRPCFGQYARLAR